MRFDWQTLPPGVHGDDLARVLNQRMKALEGLLRRLTTDTTGAYRLAESLTVTGKLALGGALDFTGTAAIQEAGTERGRISGGVLAWGTTVTTGASAGDVVLANGQAVRGVLNTGTSTRQLVGITGANNVILGDPNTGLFMWSSDLGSSGQRVTAGANDSAGAGFRVLRIPNA